ncbi:MAG TPA: MarR family transcriptional regulator [Acidimicrobiales bacterium]|nr:MarR family transcriptional regulator [Acidimicrobiales bacterium]
MSDQHGDGDFQTAFWDAKRAIATASEAAFGRHGVRAGQQYILLALWEEDCLAPGEVALRLGLSTPTVTRAATRMEAAGLLARRPHPSDRRLVRLCLTDRGRSLQEAIDREMDDLTDRALATLDPSERAAFVRYLTEMQRNLTR